MPKTRTRPIVKDDVAQARYKDTLLAWLDENMAQALASLPPPPTVRAAGVPWMVPAGAPWPQATIDTLIAEYGDKSLRRKALPPRPAAVITTYLCYPLARTGERPKEFVDVLTHVALVGLAVTTDSSREANWDVQSVSVYIPFFVETEVNLVDVLRRIRIAEAFFASDHWAPHPPGKVEPAVVCCCATTYRDLLARQGYHLVEPYGEPGARNAAPAELSVDML